jgi:formate dehydrogenase alpha subunit
VAGLVTTFGSGAMTNSLSDLSDAGCILAIGTNTTEAHPIIGMNIRRAARQGTKLIVANPLEIDLVRDANLWLRHRSGTDVVLLMGMMKVIVDEGLMDSAFIEQRCENYDFFKHSLKNFPLELVESITGVPGDKIAAAARIYATSGPATILYAMGITQHTHGTDNVIATANLAMLTGNIGKPGTGVNPLRGQNNVQGACDVGALPNVYPGYQSVSDEIIREKFEAAWECPLNPDPGQTLTEIIPAAHEGKIKAVYLMGENPYLSDPDASHVRQALKKLEFFVVQDIFLSETAQLADVVLPATSFAEKDGTFTNTERRVQRVRKAIEPVGNSRPDWWITCQIARGMGARGFDFDHPARIMDEIARVTPSYGGINYSRLEEDSLQWPCPIENHPGTPILHTELFTRGKGHFVPLEYKPSAELPDDEYPLILTTDRSLFQFHTGTMTRKVRGLNVFQGEELVAINPGDAEALGIEDGETVLVTSRRGEVAAKARVTESALKGTIAMTFHFVESPTNELTNPAFDPVAKIPEFKVCAVRIKKNGKAVARTA